MKSENSTNISWHIKHIKFQNTLEPSTEIFRRQVNKPHKGLCLMRLWPRNLSFRLKYAARRLKTFAKPWICTIFEMSALFSNLFPTEKSAEISNYLKIRTHPSLSNIFLSKVAHFLSWLSSINQSHTALLEKRSALFSRTWIKSIAMLILFSQCPLQVT